jgi:hypothetical protein
MDRVQEPASIINDHAVDPFLARVTLDRLRARGRDALAGGAAAALLAVLSAVTGNVAIIFPCIAGALAGCVVFAFARADRTALIERLIRQRSAYEIAEVAAAAQDLVTPQARARLARSLSRLVLEADGFEPQSLAFAACYARVRSNRGEFIMIAYHLARPSSRVHPSGVALIQRLLANPMVSPLYNETLPPQQLRVALQRVQQSISGL